MEKPDMIKPEQIIGPITFTILLFGVSAFVMIVLSMFVHICDTNNVEFHNIYYIVSGMIQSIPTIMLIAYVKWTLLTGEQNSAIFAEMRSLSIVAVYPFLTGVIKYFGISSFSYMYIHISPYEVFDFIVMTWLVVESVYTAKLWREQRAHKEQESNHIISL